VDEQLVYSKLDAAAVCICLAVSGICKGAGNAACSAVEGAEDGIADADDIDFVADSIAGGAVVMNTGLEGAVAVEVDDCASVLSTGGRETGLMEALAAVVGVGGCCLGTLVVVATD